MRSHGSSTSVGQYVEASGCDGSIPCLVPPRSCRFERIPQSTCTQHTDVLEGCSVLMGHNPSSAIMSVTFRALSPAEAEAAHAIEVAAYAPGKAATLMQIRHRIHRAGGYFLGVYKAATLVGFVNGTLSAQRELTDDSMAGHDAHGHYLCIHSLVIAASHRRQGLATKLLSTYVRRLVNEVRAEKASNVTKHG